MKRVVLIKSCRRNTDKLAACNDTWVRDLRRLGFHCVTLVGGGTRNVVCENLIILAGSNIDARTRIGDKFIAGLRLLNAQTEFDYVFVADDDTFVHPARWSGHKPSADLEGRLFFPGNCKAPWVHGGCGWYMSKYLARAVAAYGNPDSVNDDVLVGRVMAQCSAAFSISHCPALYAGDEYSGHDGARVKANNEFITCHHVGPIEMRSLYASLVSNDVLRREA